MATFLVLRAEGDKGRVFRVHGHTVDPNIGEHGGFVLKTVRISHTKQELANPKKPAVRGNPVFRHHWTDAHGNDHVQEIPRKVLRTWKTGQGDLECENYECEATEYDARKLAAVHPGWRYQRVMSEAEVAEIEKAYGDAQPTVEPVVGEPEPEGEAPPAKPLSGYRAVQEEARTLMAEGCPPIALNSPKSELEEYIAAHRDGADDERESVGDAGGPTGGEADQ